MFTLAKFLSFGIEIQTIMGTRILDFQFIWRLQRTKASHMKATVIQTSYKQLLFENIFNKPARSNLKGYLEISSPSSKQLYINDLFFKNYSFKFKVISCKLMFLRNPANPRKI
jgi:hypothetical protein